MDLEIPRLRMFAGPNGSGKSTIKSVIRSELLGVYINPDDIEKEIRTRGDFLDLESYGVHTTEEEILLFFQNSILLKEAGLLHEAADLSFSDGKLNFYAVTPNAYFASVAADFIRQKLIQTKTSFTFETVMSSPDKINLLQKAQLQGYRTYLYFIATEDPLINISRVQHRVKMGGHDVPREKIISRYERSLDLLMQAVRFAHRTYIFDNSNHQYIWLAEITEGKVLEMKSSSMPGWFKKAVWEKIPARKK